MNCSRNLLFVTYFVVFTAIGYSQTEIYSDVVKVYNFSPNNPSVTTDSLHLNRDNSITKQSSNVPKVSSPISVNKVKIQKLLNDAPAKARTDAVCLTRQLTLVRGTLNGAFIRGQVVSNKGEAMTGASAYLIPDNIRVPILEDGSYLLDGLENTTYTVAIVHPGFYMYMTRITATENNNTGTVLVMRRSSDINEMDTIKRELDRVQRVCAGRKFKETVLHPYQPDVQGTSGLIIEAPMKNVKGTPAIIDNHEHHAEDLVTEVSVQPNPAQEVASITFLLANDSKVLLEVFSVATGERVLLQDIGEYKSGTNSTRINISNFTRGSYTVLIRASTCQYALTTFIKE